MKFDTEGKTIDGWKTYCSAAILEQVWVERLKRELEWSRMFEQTRPNRSRWQKFKSRIAYRWGCFRYDLGSWIAGGLD